MKSNISERMYRMRNRHFGTLVALIIFIILLAVVLQLIIGNEELRRYCKTLTSQYRGLNRTVSVYSYDGDLIQSWTGKFDVDRTEAGVLFDVDGKRVVIQGGIIINEED